MTYAYSKADINKELYEVQIRNTATFEDPATDNQLKALANDLGGFGTATVLSNTDSGSDVDTANHIYDLDATVGNVSIDLALETIVAESDGDILIFRAYNVANTITITDENSVATTLTVVNEIAVFVYDGTGGKWEYWCKITAGDTAVILTQGAYFTEIGVLDEGPNIITEKADTRPTHKGYELYTKNIKFECNDLQVNESNSDFYRAVAGEGNVDIMFYCPDNINKTVWLLNFPLENYLDVKGNTWNTIPLSALREINPSVIDTYIKLYG